jgi:hypothetical protein
MALCRLAQWEDWLWVMVDCWTGYTVAHPDLAQELTLFYWDEEDGVCARPTPAGLVCAITWAGSARIIDVHHEVTLTLWILEGDRLADAE